ncbi:MAG: endolytic transglycosylase MltG [Terriglobales bacterium]
MNRRHTGIVVVVVIVAALALGLWRVWAPGPRLAQPRIIAIAPGTGRTQIARLLQQQGVIASAFGFDLWAFLHFGSTLKAGPYRLPGGESVPAVFHTLSRGVFYTISLTVPEGYTRFDIARELQQKGIASADAFLAASASPALVHDLDPGAVSLEGYLFPATYRVPFHASVQQIIKLMLQRFHQEVQRDHPHNVHRWVTLASLIQKETAVPAERALIAGVFDNRLQRGLPLQCDPTVIYAALLDHAWTGSLHARDLKRKSPYNTYLHTGLPPGPISNPGRASLEAAQHPDETDYLYFVSNGAGAHRFAETLAQQQKNVRRYLKTLRQQHDGDHHPKRR